MTTTVQSQHRNLGEGIRVATPKLALTIDLQRIVPDATGLRRDRVQMVGEAGTLQRGKCVVGENEILGVGPVIRDVCLMELR